MEVQFFGAAGTVTGSKFLVRSGDTSVLVDCGLFQGHKELRLRNWQDARIDLETLTAVVLTHAHIDHSGYLPLLIKNGFKGPVYCSAPTADLCAVLLPDSARIQEEDAAYANRMGFSKHNPALPLYSEQNAEVALNHLRVVEVGDKLQIGSMHCDFFPAGHILGATAVKLHAEGRSIVFSGDVGRYNDLMENQPQPFGEATYVVLESTYGDRIHPKSNPVQVLADEVQETFDKGGVLLIPSFAVGRAQLLLYCLAEAYKKKLCPRIPVYVNSPMATRVSGLYLKHTDWHRLSESDCRETFGIARFVSSVEESIALNRKAGPMIILSASGMLTGGRVLHHLKHFGGSKKNTILLAGFQAPGTRGHALASGQRTIKLHGQSIDIYASVKQLDAFSAHADQDELITYLRRSKSSPKQIFLVHGEPAASATLGQRVQEELGIPAVVPKHGDVVKF